MMDRNKAIKILQGMKPDIAPGVCKIEIAGSIRRGKDEVKDAELVIMPGPGWAAVRAGLVAKYGLARYGDKGLTRNGDKYLGLAGPGGLKVEVFTADADNWGYIYWLRTGPGQANTFIMTRLKQVGAPIRAEGGYWWRGDVKLTVPTEEAMFDLLGMPYIRPGERSGERYHQEFRRAGHKFGEGVPAAVQVVKVEQKGLF